MTQRRFALAAVMVLILAGVAMAQALPPHFIKVSKNGEAIPDVDKPSPANPNDGSCWLAGAANVLAAAGYGAPAGAPAQQRAQSIYNQMRFDWATSNGIPGGAPDQAISHWLAHYGRNPDHADFNLAVDYTDVTAKYGTLGLADYDFLRQEVYDCKYVTVQFETPPHCMTLVGWDHNVTPNKSIWHDSDVVTPAPGDDAYDNVATSNPDDWDLFDPIANQNYMNNANGYSVFCPGLDKPEEAMRNYDVAWAPGPNGPAARYAGAQNGVFLTPAEDPTLGWQQVYTYTDPTTGNTTSYEPYRIDNEFDPLLQKQVHVLVDFYDRDANHINEDIRLRYFDELGNEVVVEADSALLSDDSGQLLLTWELDIQPDWEEVLFPASQVVGLNYLMLEDKVASWDVATICVPEPAAFGLIGIAGVLVIARRRAAPGLAAGRR